MTKDKVEELKEKFDTLIELGVVFRYGSEDIEQGEITNIEFTEDDTVKFVVRTQKGCDIREGLFKAFCDRNITLLEMHSAVKSLEDVFLELTGEGETE